MNKARSHAHRFFSAAVLSVFLLFHLSSIGQTTQDLPQFTPPSPNAYSLGKYGDVPVSLYTGVPDITIPLWTLQERDLSVGVSLSYHGSGIKVDEIASWVGLGWSLNAGGVITRTVRAQAEHLISDGTLRPIRADIDFYSGPTDYASRNAFAQSQQLQAAANGSLDTEPDVYFFNFLGRSGKFVFDRDGQAVLYKHEALDIKLRYVSTDFYDIIITAEDGTVYEFAQHETTFFPSLSQTDITSWYLSKIKSPRGSEITFEYQGLPSVRHNIRELSQYQAELQAATQTQIVPSIGPAVDMTATELAIKKINTDDGWIEFKLSTQPRQDYESPSYALDSIIVYRSDGSVHRKFKLNTSYFEANDADKYDGVEPESFGHLNYRLRLENVQEFGPDNGPAKPPYGFEYWGDSDPATDDVYTLPYRLSPNQDHWGYFNNANNEHIFPGNDEGRPITTEAWLAYDREWANITVTNTLGNGANREPDAEAVKACALKSVHYPTGGHTDYLFETNKWNEMSIGGGLRIQKIVEYTGAAQAKETNFDYDVRGQTLDPRDLYYKVYRIVWDDATHQWDPVPEMLANYGITTPDGPRDADMVKISTFPQAILGGGAPAEYAVVTVSQPGIGSTRTLFSTTLDFVDYYGIDDVYDEIDMFEIEHLFDSQYLTTVDRPDIIYSAVTKTGITDWPYPVPYDNSWKRGVMTGRSTYSEDMHLLQKETFLYKRELLDAIPAYKVRSWDNDGEFIYSKYYIPHAWINLKKHIVEQYDVNGENPIVTTTEYYHDNPAHAQTTRMLTTNSEGKRLVSITSYPGDYSVGEIFIDDMKASHVLSRPVEQVTYEEDVNGDRSILSATLTVYKPGGVGLKDQVLTVGQEKPIPSTSFKFSNRPMGTLPPEGVATQFSPDSRYAPFLTFDLYDKSGNTLQYTNVRDGRPRSYVWGYNGQFPVAEVINGRTITGGVHSMPFDGESTAMFLSSADVDRESNVTISVDLLPSDVDSSYQQIDVMIDLTRGTEHITTLTFNFAPVSTHGEQTLMLAAGDYSLNYLGKADSGDPDYTFSGMFSYVSTRSTVFHTSFEEDTEDISIDAKTGGQSHSGAYALVMPPTAGEFIISYWEKTPGAQWTYHQIDRTAVANEPDMIIGASGHLIDEVRMYPRGAQMTTYTFDELNGMTSVTDANNITRTYDYDSVARLSAIKDDAGNVIKKYSYHYKGN